MLGVMLAPSRRAHAQSRPVSDSLARDALARDSLAARLARAEANIELLRKQLAVESETMVRSRSRLRVELFARLLTNAFITSGRVNTNDVPQFALVPARGGVSSPGTRSSSASVRQSRVGAAVAVDSVLGGHFDGDFELDFFGGVATGAGDRKLFPEPRLRTARARLSWPRTEVMVGSAAPLVSELNPISMAAVGLPGFVAAGNLWNWLPQVRVTREILGVPGGVRVAVQGALLAPFASAQHVAETDATDAAERAVRPYMQARARVRWGDADGQAPGDADLSDAGGEIAFGVHRGWLRADVDSLRSSRALTMDWRVMVRPGLEVRGEAYDGQLLRGLGGGAIAQNFGRATLPALLGPSLRDRAAWVQVNGRLHPTLIAGAGCGLNRVNPRDLPARDRNTVCAVHTLWRPAQPMLVGVEFRQIRTHYPSGAFRVNHFNLALGFEL